MQVGQFQVGSPLVLVENGQAGTITQIIPAQGALPPTLVLDRPLVLPQYSPATALVVQEVIAPAFTQITPTNPTIAWKAVQMGSR